MSLVVANASSGPTTITLSAITASGIVTVKDSGSASGTNTVTIVATAGNTFESGLTSYVLNTASAYMTFVGNASTLKWRVLGSTYADVPVVSPVPSPPALGGNLSATLNSLSVSGQATIPTLRGISGPYSVNFPLKTVGGICFDPSGNMYVGDSGSYVIYKITPQGQVILFAGTYLNNSTVDGYGTAASMNDPFQMVYDTYSGWIIFGTLACVRAMNPVTAQVITLCGSSTRGNATGLGGAASFRAVTGLCSEGNGTLYVADNQNHNICKITYSLPITAGGGTKTIIAGSTAATGVSGYYNTTTGTSSTFYYPYGLTINSARTFLYVADNANNVIRRVSLTSPFAVITYAGPIGSSATPGNTTIGTSGHTDSTTLSSATFIGPAAIIVDSSNNLIVTEGGGYLRYINTTNNYTLTLAGSGASTNTSGVGANGTMWSPCAVFLDNSGTAWIGTNASNGAIFSYNFKTGFLTLYYQSISPTQIYTPANPLLPTTAMSTITSPGLSVGTLTTGPIYGSGYTIANQTATNYAGATYANPVAILMDPTNNLYVADGYKIRKISPSGIVTSIYGDPSNTQGNPQVGTGSLGQTSFVYGMCFDNSGNILFTQNSFNPNVLSSAASAQQPSSVINRLNPNTGVLTTISLSTPLQTPKGIAYDGVNTLYVVCTNANLTAPLASYIVSINMTTGTVTTIAGSSSEAGDVDGPGASARFANATGICIDKTKQNLYVCVANSAKVKKIVISTSVVSTAFGVSGANVITMDASSNLYVGSAFGVFSIFKSEPPYSSVASWSTGYAFPQGITVDSYNNIYLADATGKAIYYIRPTGTSSLYSGVIATTGSQDSVFASSITLMAPYVGINNANPTSALDVNGNANISGTLNTAGGFIGKFATNAYIQSIDAKNRMYFTNNGDTAFSVPNGFSFYFQNAVSGNVSYINGTSGTYNVLSDQRIKKNIVSTTDSLDIINQINIVKYDYIHEERGSVKHGIIAQELQQVYPDAVGTIRNVIPSHLTVVDFDLEGSNTVLIKCSTPHDLIVNDTVKLDIGDTYSEKVILEIPSDTTFIVSSWDNFSATSSVTLYGKYVDDFLSYDKSQIGLLAAGACQTLSGQVSTLQSESLTYSSTISTLQSDSLTYSSTISTLQSDSLTYSSTISTLQSDSDLKTSTITGLQSALDSQQSTITSILTKIST